MTEDFRESEPWRVFRIMSEFVEGFEVLRKYGLAASFFGTARQTFEQHFYDDANVLAIAADYTDEETVKKMLSLFLETPFDTSERRMRRLQELTDIERKIKG